jgi:hypothetical protein
LGFVAKLTPQWFDCNASIDDSGPLRSSRTKNFPYKLIGDQGDQKLPVPVYSFVGYPLLPDDQTCDDTIPVQFVHTR